MKLLLFKDQHIIKVSSKSARLKFIECGPECIANGCTAKCCDAPTHPDGCIVFIHPTEKAALVARGARVSANFIKPKHGAKGCPFKLSSHLCGLHNTPDKPFGCIVSPFMLNSNDTLIIRNRYKMLPCYQPEIGRPAYHVFFSSLVKIFGNDISEKIKRKLDTGSGDLSYRIKQDVYDKLTHREKALK